MAGAVVNYVARVTSFEAVDSVTFYIIEVFVSLAGSATDKEKGLAKVIKRRYSQFIKLHATLALKYPQLSCCMLPGKDYLFSDSSRREGRMRVFDLYVKLLLSICRAGSVYDDEVAQFLELHELRSALNDTKRNGSSGTMQLTTAAVASHGTGSAADNLTTEQDITSDMSISGNFGLVLAG
jgi:hypothetical protein